jgi:rod shape-determining protein MreC
MNTLLKLLTRLHPLLLLLILLSISLSLIVRFNENQGAIASNSTSVVVSKIYSVVDMMTGFFTQAREIRELQEENAKLRAQLPTGLTTSAERDTFQRNLDSNVTVIYTYIPAQVINNSINRENNYITLNRGTADRVEEGMGVITPNGVLGVVRHVRKNYCLVMSVLHSQNRISAQIKGKEIYGSLVWDGQDPRYAQLIDIPKHHKIKANGKFKRKGQKPMEVPGDLVETSGFSAYYPPKIAIGEVHRFWTEPGSPSTTVQVKLNNDLSTVRNAYIVVHKDRKELKHLEAQQK